MKDVDLQVDASVVFTHWYLLDAAELFHILFATANNYISVTLRVPVRTWETACFSLFCFLRDFASPARTIVLFLSFLNNNAGRTAMRRYT
jgi:hypothetical protein